MNTKNLILLLAITIVTSSSVAISQDRDPRKQQRFRQLQEKRKRMSKRGGRPGRNGAGNAADANSLKVGQMAPDFKLKSLDGKTETQLKAFRGKKPVVLFFGSYT